MDDNFEYRKCKETQENSKLCLTAEKTMWTIKKNNKILKAPR